MGRHPHAARHRRGGRNRRHARPHDLRRRKSPRPPPAGGQPHPRPGHDDRHDHRRRTPDRPASGSVRRRTGHPALLRDPLVPPPRDPRLPRGLGGARADVRRRLGDGRAERDRRRPEPAAGARGPSGHAHSRDVAQRALHGMGPRPVRAGHADHRLPARAPRRPRGSRHDRRRAHHPGDRDRRRPLRASTAQPPVDHRMVGRRDTVRRGLLRPDLRRRTGPRRRSSQRRACRRRDAP